MRIINILQSIYTKAAKRPDSSHNDLNKIKFEVALCLDLDHVRVAALLIPRDFGVALSDVARQVGVSISWGFENINEKPVQPVSYVRITLHYPNMFVIVFCEREERLVIILRW